MGLEGPFPPIIGAVSLHDVYYLTFPVREWPLGLGTWFNAIWAISNFRGLIPHPAGLGISLDTHTALLTCCPKFKGAPPPCYLTFVPPPPLPNNPGSTTTIPHQSSVRLESESANCGARPRSKFKFDPGLTGFGTTIWHKVTPLLCNR